ncbi:hypothetical protein [Desulfosporosinus metallidurans]|uniref:Uncharacterized protein n=1 Tax=Desulfosporosinus metallidurans TaxID=1888891 RepID=A0A1Q8QII3_9FIRM|nr:hypothetical protein [Desulfosporosinus metallidurans]OLN27157.1 hypothetical protein DSOL_4669 [Desulfosporosinus metallidurans]
MKKDTQKLRALLEISNVPEGLIRELEAKPVTYQTPFIETIEQIMRNEVLNLTGFMEMRENLKEKVKC